MRADLFRRPNAAEPPKVCKSPLDFTIPDDDGLTFEIISVLKDSVFPDVLIVNGTLDVHLLNPPFGAMLSVQVIDPGTGGPFVVVNNTKTIREFRVPSSPIQIELDLTANGVLVGSYYLKVKSK